MSEPEKQKKSLEDKVNEWLSEEGYGLEFLTADIFSKRNFQVRQGYYVRDEQTQTPREIDVIAQEIRVLASNLADKFSYLRIEYVVECKWSKDKPWVVFSSYNHAMSPSDCIRQTIASLTGASILWTLAADTKVQNLEMFSVPPRPGYGGRQALSKGNDIFYSTMQSIISSASSLAKSYDKFPIYDVGQALENATIIFPVIVIDGRLFEAYFDEMSGKTKLDEVKTIRVHWRGAEVSANMVTVDLVTLEELDNFVKNRRSEIDTVLDAMQNGLGSIQYCYTQKSLSSLKISRSARRLIELPFVLEKIRQLEEEAELRGRED